MAEKKVIELEINSNLGTLKQQFKEAQLEVQALSEKFGATSAQAVEAAKSAALLKDKISDAKSLTDAFNPDAKFKAVTGALTGVAGGFSVVTGALGAFGKQNESVEKALLKVQSAMALASGAQAIGESIDSFKQLGAVIKATSVFQGIYNFVQTGSITATTESTVAKVADAQATVAQGTATVATTTATTGASVALKVLRAALISTGVGALVAGLGMLIANLDSIIGFFSGATNANLKNEAAIKKNTAALNTQVKANEKASTALKTKNGHEYKMAEASGASANALHKLAIRHANEEIALERASKATAHNTYVKEKNTLAYYRSIDASDDVIAKQTALVKATMENSIKEGKDLAGALENKAQLIRDNDVRIAGEKTKSREKEVKTNDNHNKEVKTKDKVQAKEIIDISKQIEDEKLRLQDESLAKELEALKLKYERKKEEEEKQKKAGTLTKKSFEALQIQATESFEYDKKQIIEKYVNQESQLKTVSSRNAIQGLVDSSKTRLEIEKTTSEKSIEISKEEKEKKAEILQQQLTLVKDSFQAFADVSTLFAGKNKKAQKIAFNIQKGANIAQTTIDTYTAAMSAYKSALAVPVIGVGLAPIAAAGAVAAGLMNIKKIAASKFEGGETPSASGGGGGGGATVPTMSAPQFNVVGQSGVNQLASLNQQPVQAYVVSGQVTSQQALDRNRLANATLGG